MPDRRRPLTLKRLMVVVAVIAITFGVIAGIERRMANRLTLENRSGQTIVWVQLSVTNSDSAAMFEIVPDGAQVSFPFQIGGDGDFRLVGKLADGTALSAESGYVTPGYYGERPRFIVKQGGKIDFSD